MVYSNAHRFLLRKIASQGVTSFENCMNILKGLPDFTGTSFQTVINEINEEIIPYQQEIKIVIDELTTERKVVFLSCGYDDATMSQNVFSPKELDYFRILIENIMTTENREIEINAALNLASNVKPVLKKIDAEIILNTWCTIHYLDKNEKCYALGIRAIHEFKDYLQRNMPDTIRNCSNCKINVFRGVNCPACYASIHTRCLNLQLEKIKKWPCCKVAYGTNSIAHCSNAMYVSALFVIIYYPSTATSSAPFTLLEQIIRLTQTQLIQNSSNEPMDVSQIDDETEALNITAPRRKRKRISSN